MDIDISKVMTYEIRKEMAERYFGFRKLIEEDKAALAKAIRRQTITVEQTVCIDLVRIYTMLKDRRLIDRFLAISGLEEALFYDEYVVSSPTIRAKIFAGIKAGGLTRSGRFTRLLLGCYELLVDHVGRYREKFGELLEERELIKEEIELFYRKNDIDTILGFLRSLDGQGNEMLAAPLPVGGARILKEKMEVLPPAPVESHLPLFPPLVPMPGIRKELKKLAQQALKEHPHGFVLG
ncbi:MAG: hypothetical protein RQ753_04095 [Desulfurivibrionaceae bacterium]|nr:hypothetical protein [Desulfurivibrionaceae bacterium]